MVTHNESNTLILKGKWLHRKKNLTDISANCILRNYVQTGMLCEQKCIILVDLINVKSTGILAKISINGA